jgi:hypothetical protein
MMVICFLDNKGREYKVCKLCKRWFYRGSMIDVIWRNSLYCDYCKVTREDAKESKKKPVDLFVSLRNTRGRRKRSE